MRTFEIGGVTVGGGAAPIVLPDIGTFFNQDISRAEALIDGVAAAGGRFVKGEILHRADVALDDATLESYYSEASGVVTERYRALVERKVVPLPVYETLFRRCMTAGMKVVVSVYDFEGADFARRIGCVAIKIASSNVVHEPLIRHVGGFGLPMILDTGKSSMEEIARAVQWARDAGTEKLVVEHSPDAPPAPLAQHHLRMLATLAQVFACPVGLSDHHAGTEMMLAATALGASILEKGLCPDDAALDQDVTHAMRLSELPGVLRSCEMIHAALGEPMRQLRRDRPKPAARMGLVAKRDLAPGAVVDLENVDFAWPAKGIPVEEWSRVRGWVLTQDVRQGVPVRWSDVRSVDA